MVARHAPERPPAASGPEEVVDRMLDGLQRGDFYLWCQDNETPRAVEEKRILWNALDIIENRPALSRWHDDWKAAFSTFMAES
jgi:hypothetical protein